MGTESSIPRVKAKLFSELKPRPRKKGIDVSPKVKLISTLNSLFPENSEFIYKNLDYYSTMELIYYTIDKRKEQYNINNSFDYYLDDNMEEIQCFEECSFGEALRECLEH